MPDTTSPDIEAFRKFLTNRRIEIFERLSTIGPTGTANGAESRLRERAYLDELEAVLEAFNRHFPR